MKILVDGMPKEKGGIGTFLLNMARWSKISKDIPVIDFAFLVPEKSEYKKIIEKIGCKCFSVTNLIECTKYKESIDKVLEQDNYDFIWINNTSKVNGYIIKAAIRNHIKILTHPHGVDNEEKGIKKIVFHFLDRTNQRLYFENIAVPLACSHDAALSYYKGSESLLNKCTVINNGIFTNDYKYSNLIREDIRKKLGISDHEILIGTVGRMAAVKNHTFLIELLHGLPDAYKLIILGDGEERSRIEVMIGQFNLENRVILAGQINDVNNYLTAMDIFVLPSLHEGMPLSVIEAQADGLPCIISDSVSKEVKITDLVRFAKLNDISDWKKYILFEAKEIHNFKRDEYADIIAKSGYGIEQSFSLFQEALKNSV